MNLLPNPTIIFLGMMALGVSDNLAVHLAPTKMPT